jgi:fructokinase
MQMKKCAIVGLQSKTLSNIMRKTIAFFGEILADVFPDRSVLGGAPFNAARHLQAFGHKPRMITRIGQDTLGQELIDAMESFGINTSDLQRDTEYPTGQVKVHIESAGHRFEILPDQAYDHIRSDELIVTTEPPDMIYFGTLAQRCPQSRYALDIFLANNKSPRFLDINLRQPWYDLNTIERSLLLANQLKINDEELAIVARMLNLKADHPELQAAALLENFDLDVVLVTCGANGAWALERGRDIVRAPSKGTILLADTVGAGDAFASVYMLGWLAGWPMETTLARANDFAGAICTIRGAAPEEVETFYAPFKQAWKL